MGRLYRLVSRGGASATAILGVALFLLVVGIAVAQQAGGEQSPADSELEATLRNALNSGRLDSSARTAAEYKLKALLDAESERNAAPKRTKPAPYSDMPPAQPRQPVPVGIIELKQPPVSSSYATITNAWRAERPDGSATEVYAGVLQDPDTGRAGKQGVLLVFSTNPAGGVLGAGQEIRSPVANGALTIESATGNTLLVRVADGTTLTFNAERRRFEP